jgi:large subunit ribosomal protein L22
MEIKAVQKYTRQSPRKVRLVANAVRKLPLEQAVRQLAVIEKKATDVISKVMKQAIADAINNHGYQMSELSLVNILITEGPRYRRFQAVSRGRAHGIIKRTCHVTVILKSADETVKPVASAPIKEMAAEVEKTASTTAAKEVKTKTVKKEKPTAKKAASSK